MVAKESVCPASIQRLVVKGMSYYGITDYNGLLIGQYTMPGYKAVTKASVRLGSSDGLLRSR